MKLAFYGSSLLSSYWNGAATYYRGMLSALAEHGWSIQFLEPDAFDRQSHRDIEAPDWAEVVVYSPTPAGLDQALAAGADADVVIKASGVGVLDTELLQLFSRSSPRTVRIFWDVDAPATLGEIKADPDHPLRAVLPSLDAVFTYGGGPRVIAAYRALGAADCVPVYNALDPDSHRPTDPQSRFSCDLSLLANRLPDREARIDSFFLEPAARLADKRFLLGGSGWEGKALPANVTALGHVGTAEHNAFNVSARAILNVSRESMAETGFSPATRVFEAAGAGACLITDAWDGVELFLKPGEEILVARDGREVADLLESLGAATAARIGAAARRRVLAEHTYAQRAVAVDARLRKAVLGRRGRTAA